MNNNYIAILAGGKGERLWPLSRNRSPKQLLPFIDKKTLLEHTLDRLEGLVPDNNILVVTNNEQYEPIKQLNNSVRILCEPVSRNTAAAILLTCLTIQKENPEAYITFVPADHYIKDSELFRNYIKELNTATDELCLLGVDPKYPATGYGYIQFDAQRKYNHLFTVIKFHEKPTMQKAQEYCQQKNFLWNIGVFAGTIKTFVNKFAFHCPELYDAVHAYFEGLGKYEVCANISFDHAILEKVANSFVMPINIEWSDVGNLDTFLSLGHSKSKKILEINAQNNNVYNIDKLVALVGVDDLCIVQTDDVLLIAKRDELEKVKQIVNELKNLNKKEYL